MSPHNLPKVMPDEPGFGALRSLLNRVQAANLTHGAHVGLEIRASVAALPWPAFDVLAEAVDQERKIRDGGR